MPEDVGRFLDEICDQAEDAEMKLKRVGKLAANALSTSWLYNGKDHVETQVRKIADICPENVKEHAPLSARASINRGVGVEKTGEHVNRAADRGCSDSTCSAYFSLG